MLCGLSVPILAGVMEGLHAGRNPTRRNKAFNATITTGSRHFITWKITSSYKPQFLAAINLMSTFLLQLGLVLLVLSLSPTSISLPISSNLYPKPSPSTPPKRVCCTNPASLRLRIREVDGDCSR